MTPPRPSKSSSTSSSRRRAFEAPHRAAGRHSLSQTRIRSASKQREQAAARFAQIAILRNSWKVKHNA